MSGDFELLASLGLSVFPLEARKKTPSYGFRWKYYHDHYATSEERASWAAGGHNVAIATGALSGIIVLDTDNDEALAEARRLGLPETLSFSTPRGNHFAFRHPGGYVGNRAAFLPGMDIRGDRGYVVSAGSYFEPTPTEQVAGKRAGSYDIISLAPPAVLPEWLAQYLIRDPSKDQPSAPFKVAEETTVYGLRALHAELKVLSDAQAGHNLNNQINRSAFVIAQLVGGGEIVSEEAWDALSEGLAGHNVEHEPKASKTRTSGWNAGILKPRKAPERLTAEQAFGTREVSSDDVPLPPLPEKPARGTTLYTDQLPAYFAGCVYVVRQDAIYAPNRGLLKKSAFDTCYGGYEFQTKTSTGGTGVSAWDGFRLAPGWACPTADDICFRPDLTAGAVVHVEGRPMLNTWEPVVTDRTQGDASPLIALLTKLLPVERDRQILMAYMCALVQNPGRKFQWWPVLQGAQGNGKTAIFRILSHAVGHRYTHLINADAMAKTGGQFNNWIQGNLLLGVEEIFVSDRRHLLETFKPIVTNDRISIEAKGVGQTTGDNRANGIMFTNHRDGVPIADGDRRYAILWTAQQRPGDLKRDGMTQDYFSDLYDWLNGRNAYVEHGSNYGFRICNEWLSTAVPEVEFNPAGGCQRAPETSSTAAAKVISRGIVEDEIHEAIEQEETGFAGGWISSTWLDKLLERIRVKMTFARRRETLASMGYEPHPALHDGRASSVLGVDGKKSRLYVRAGHLSINLTTPASVAEAYEKAQNVISTADAVFGKR